MANHYVRAGVIGGDDSGSSWANAKADFTGTFAPNSLIRGDTYYVATGTYAALQVTTPEVGTSILTIKGATAADNGGAGDWNASYGVDVAQAHFGYGTNIRRNYVTFDGNYGAVWESNPANYGFLIDLPASCATQGSANEIASRIFHVTGSTTIHDVIYKHVAIVQCGSAVAAANPADSSKGGNRGIYVGGSTQPTNLVTVSTCYISDCQVSTTIDNSTNTTMEYMYLNGNWSVSTAHHGVTVQFRNSSTIHFRYNFITGSRGTGSVGWYDPGVSTNQFIYGNIVVDGQGGNGVFTSGSATVESCSNTFVYNNTIISCTGRFFQQGEGPSPGTGNLVKNNIIWNGQVDALGSGTTFDYNSYLSATGGTPPTDAHGQTATLDPFVSSGTGNYRLANGTSVSAGLSLGAPYNADVLGNTRGADATWDRGAYEFTGDILAPAAPTNITVQ